MFELSEDKQAIQEMARDFARSEVLPGSMERDKTHEFPADLVAQLAELGLMGGGAGRVRSIATSMAGQCHCQ